MPYSHDTRAGNQGDVVKHCALITVIQRLAAGGLKKLVFGDTFSGGGRHAKVPRGDWRHGIGKLANNLSLPKDPAIQHYLNKYGGPHTSILYDYYPGSSVIAADFDGPGMKVVVNAWDISVDAVSDLAAALSVQKPSGGKHRVTWGEALVADVASVNLLLLDPPKREWKSMEQFIAGLAETTCDNILLWLPVPAVPSGNSFGPGISLPRHSRPAKQLQVDDVIWNQHPTNTFKPVGCQLVYAFKDPSIERAVASCVANVINAMGWPTGSHRQI